MSENIGKFIREERNHQFLLMLVLLASLMMLAGRFLITKNVMGGDAVIYFVNVHSILYDRDLDLKNEYVHFYSQHSPYTGNRKLPFIPPENPVTGELPILYPVGSVILLAPFYYFGHFVSVVLQLSGVEVNANGLGNIYQVSVAFGSLVYGVIGLILSYLASRKVFDPQVALIGTILIWGATPLVYYMTMEPLMSHSLSMFCVALFIFLWIKVREQESCTHWMILGVVGGLLSIVRYQDATFLIIPVLGMGIHLAQNIKTVNWLQTFTKLFAFLLGVLLIASIQFYVNYKMNGSPLSTGYTVEGYHPTNLFPFWDSPNVLYILFSTKSGLLLWSPVIVLSLVGIFLFWKSEPFLSIPLIVALLIQFYVVSIWHDPSQGESFGNRYLVNSTIIFAFGLMKLLSRFKETQKFYQWSAMLSIFILINGALILLYGLRFIGGAY